MIEDRGEILEKKNLFIGDRTYPSPTTLKDYTDNIAIIPVVSMFSRFDFF